MITDEEEKKNDEAARWGREETTVVGRPIRLHQRIIHHDRGEGLRLLRLYAFCMLYVRSYSGREGCCVQIWEMMLPAARGDTIQIKGYICA